MTEKRWCEEHGAWETTAFVRHVPYLRPSEDRHVGGGGELAVLLPILMVVLVLMSQR